MSLVARRRVKVEFDPDDPRSVSRTKQSFKKRVNINNIMAKAKASGLINNPLDFRAGFSGTYGDVSNSSEYHDMCNRILGAEATFMSLPADIRTRFNNDPGALLDFVNNPENADECREIGLFPKLTPSEVSALQKKQKSERDANGIVVPPPEVPEE